MLAKIDSRQTRRTIAKLLLDDTPQLEIRKVVAAALDTRHTNADLVRLIRSVKQGIEEVTRPGRYRQT